MTATYVLIHGSNSNSFGWAPLQRELALLGHRSLAVDLPGHGFGAACSPAYQAPQDLAAFAESPSASAGVTLADCVEHVAGIVRRAREHGPVIAVAHSRGGATLTALGNAIPDLLSRIVYVSAWCPVELPLGGYLTTPEFATSALADPPDVLVGDPAALGTIRMNWRTADPLALAALKHATLADGTDAEFLAFLGTLEPDENLDAGGENDRARAGTWGRVPRTYVRLTEDTSMPIALQDRFIEEADSLTPDNPFDVRSLPMSHAMFLVRPAEGAAVLAELADEV
ncbi:alpha/beta hydrolase [Prauserella cavernicola]|uniref:Alpha/beta fold hydrolase n=1 Tax=Prauserella cavernicola TaxID=2800127 RepID=A0A934QXH9_9PSEU|nr:alpha/beta fold hydrolase [Prauserella cavernicola]MBK1788296.1 alpha/beta fold hydrolase [Prauserella cavernicola]